MKVLTKILQLVSMLINIVEHFFSCSGSTKDRTKFTESEVDKNEFNSEESSPKMGKEE